MGVNASAPRNDNNDPRFVSYYEKASATERARERSEAIMSVILRSRRLFSESCENLIVADIGCNAGTQARSWLESGHTVRGLDVSHALVEIARNRNEDCSDRASFEVGCATSLPWADNTFDVALLPELLEHVQDWERALTEAIRVLKVGGTLYITTTNVLCPLQQEFNLPLYSWYPSGAKRYFLRRAMTTSPELVNYASYPAFHWFSPYSLSRFLSPRGVVSLDRFDIKDTSAMGPAARAVYKMARSMRLVRFLGHVLTRYTVVVGHKQH